MDLLREPGSQIHAMNTARGLGPQRTGIEIETIMGANAVPCSRFLTVADAMKDPQLAERGSLAEINDGGRKIPGAQRAISIFYADGGRSGCIRTRGRQPRGAVGPSRVLR
jgi:crotonobetainyl-CoA:carnitine CoA-transferase CaiB-like acyl-CoA transferase